MNGPFPGFLFILADTSSVKSPSPQRPRLRRELLRSARLGGCGRGLAASPLPPISVLGARFVWSVSPADSGSGNPVGAAGVHRPRGGRAACARGEALRRARHVAGTRPDTGDRGQRSGEASPSRPLSQRRFGAGAESPARRAQALPRYPPAPPRWGPRPYPGAGCPRLPSPFTLALRQGRPRKLGALEPRQAATEVRRAGGRAA